MSLKFFVAKFVDPLTHEKKPTVRNPTANKRARTRIKIQMHLLSVDRQLRGCVTTVALSIESSEVEIEHDVVSLERLAWLADGGVPDQLDFIEFAIPERFVSGPVHRCLLDSCLRPGDTK
jgi:hypothetical protein